jgi:iron(III) transport system substrate-binding protein
MLDRKRATVVAVSALLALFFSADGLWAQVSTPWAKKAALDAPDTAAQLYEAAKKEGKVVIYSMSSRSKDVKASFEKAYPGVAVETYDMRNTEIFEKIERENAAGIRNADVVFVKDSDGTMANDFYERGVVHSYVPKDIGAKVDDSFKAPGFAIYLEMKLVFYNTEVYDKDPIDSWWDLTRPEWKGKIMMTNPQAAIETLGLFCSFVQNAPEMAADYRREFGQDLKLSPGVANAGYEFIRRLAANDLVITNSDQEVVDAIGAAGQKNPPIGIATSSKIRDKSKGLKLGMITGLKPRTSTGNPAYLAMVEGGQHPNAAKLLVRFMAGEADGTAPGFTPFAVDGSWPTRSDVASKSKTPLAEMKLWKEDAKYNYPNTIKVTNFWLSQKKK